MVSLNPVVGTLVQLLPLSREYSHTPSIAESASLAVMAIPARILPLKSEKYFSKRLKTESPGGDVVFLVTGARELVPLARGASFIAMIDVDSSSVSREISVVPPLLEASIVEAFGLAGPPVTP